MTDERINKYIDKMKQMDEYEKLNPKERAFAIEYLKDRNAMQAAIRAGYAETTAADASKWINDEHPRKPNLKAIINKMCDVIDNDGIASCIEVLQYLTSVMRGESRAEVVVATPCGAERVDKPPEEKDKLKAADMLGKYYALYTDKTKVDADLDFNVHFDYGDDS